MRAGWGRRATRTSGFTGVVLLHPWTGSTLAFWEQAASAQAGSETRAGSSHRVLRAFRGIPDSEQLQLESPGGRCSARTLQTNCQGISEEHRFWFIRPWVGTDALQADGAPR